jgi:hypothetical protein
MREEAEGEDIMQKHVYDEDGRKFIRTVDAVPDCGTDFCDMCGDCLSCYGGDECVCSDDGRHLWIQYGEEASDGGKPVTD